MFLLDFIRYLRGFVRFKAAGDFVERFLNLTARDGIAIWDGTKKAGIYTGYVSVQSYRRLRRHAKKTGVSIRVLEKHGVPFTRYKYRHRHGLLAGVCVFLGFLFVMSLFIWRIEINGAGGTVSEDDIIRALYSLDIRPGVPRASIDVRESERRALLQLRDLSWVAINIDGSAIKVEVKERVAPPDMIDPNTPCNIIAAIDGQLLELHVFDGQPLVGVGEAVQKGQVLVSGITLDRRQQSLFRHARAEAIAMVSFRIEIAVPFNQIHYVETGGVRSRSFADLAGVQIPLFLPLRIPQPYRVEREESSVSPFGIELPISFLRERYILMMEEPVVLTKEEAQKQGLAQLNAAQEVQLDGAEVHDRKLTGMERDGYYILWADYVCTMDIAVKVEIEVGGN